MPVTVTETRTLEQLRQHYEVERELADRLRHATKEQRRTLYSEVYDELFKRVPLHPQHTNKSSPDRLAADVAEKMEILAPFLNANSVFLEVGPGDCEFAKTVAEKVARVLAIDVSDEITRKRELPANLQLVISDGSSIPVPPDSVNVAYSNQLMEHLHPDDALDQLRGLHAALKPGGVYICITPSRLTGPHDISCVFDREATGFHLKEYTVGDLAALFRQVGFNKLRIIFGGRGKFVLLPTWTALIWEKLLDFLPHSLRKAIALKPPFRWLFGVRLAGFKD
ncbi:class I SAM-dependent methyltransferase [Prosthecobacter sp.]|uniref:class I SAM-dependent methyltransferase n=1 Tax=Prosthecobacter sp. TaxID=1965333 RepID=UPI002AB83F07|nr:class I SAM-dependent methyltransferase [Prosthecobacter sp.]MDZ4405068.1 class I SAM-dependent methyltransferase [Prosthecobacter sp.]